MSGDLPSPPPKAPAILDLRMEVVPVADQRPAGPASAAEPEETGLRGVLRRRSFQIFFLAPFALYACYILLIAAPVYLSEAQFVVRAPATPTPLSLSGLGMSRSSDETQIVDAFIDSRDVIRELAKKIDLEAIYNRPEADLLSRMWKPFLPQSFEAFHKHFLEWTTADVDDTTGIVTVRAYAFRAGDAHAVSEGVLQRAEALVNRLNERAYSDRLGYAQTILDRAKNDVAVLEASLTQFRNQTGTVDLGREATAALEMIAKMTTELASMEAAMRHQIALAPNSPAIPSQKARIESFKREIAQLRSKVVGGDNSMSVELGRFERLSLERLMAARSLESAVTNLDRVRQQAQLQQFYLSRISEPGMPETAEYPKRLKWLAAVGLGLLLLWAAIRALIRFISEHDS